MLEVLKLGVMEGSTHEERMAFAKTWLLDLDKNGEKYKGHRIASWNVDKFAREVAAQLNPKYKPKRLSEAEKQARRIAKRDRGYAADAVKDAKREVLRLGVLIEAVLTSVEDENTSWLIPERLRPHLDNLRLVLNEIAPPDEAGEPDHKCNIDGTEAEIDRMLKIHEERRKVRQAELVEAGPIRDEEDSDEVA